ncbi:fumarylacetoacetate hydrolase family protein [Vibrio sonorensis]|uniref:fumarylacetoacetate hydrolase family protein n=1 Tax=Vibrio sonorensis TaxID=1004316 RepID=UPI0008D9B345|nr:fumarylacetoacetate hydrolase family protein [Vibrio sonorensis]
MQTVRVGEYSVAPSKVVCVGRNYLEHIHELSNAVPSEMVIFNKPSTAITHTLTAYHQEPLHYEGEICFVVKDGALNAVGLGLDLTKRTLQTSLKEQGLPWEKAKAFDGSAVFSRFVPLTDIPLESLEIELFINCVRVQKGGVKQMMYPPLVILDEVSSYMTLQDGDIIMTGTPKGVGEIHRGDVFLARLKSDEKTLIEVEWLAE